MTDTVPTKTKFCLYTYVVIQSHIYVLTISVDFLWKSIYGVRKMGQILFCLAQIHKLGH